MLVAMLFSLANVGQRRATRAMLCSLRNLHHRNDAWLFLNIKSRLKLSAPTVGRHGWPNADRMLIMLATVSPTRFGRMSPAFISRTPIRFGREESTSHTHCFHG